MIKPRTISRIVLFSASAILGIVFSSSNVDKDSCNCTRAFSIHNIGTGVKANTQMGLLNSNVYSVYSDSYKDIIALGNGIDVVYGDCTKFDVSENDEQIQIFQEGSSSNNKVAARVFNDTYLNDIYTRTAMNHDANSGFSYTRQYALTYSDICNKISNNNQVDVGLGIGYGPFGGSVSTGFDYSNSVEDLSTQSEFFYYFHCEKTTEYFSLNNVRDFDGMRENLSTTYTKELIEALNSSSNVELMKLYHNYGTHIVGTIYFGANLSYYYHSRTKSQAFTEDTAKSINVGFNANVNIKGVKVSPNVNTGSVIDNSITDKTSQIIQNSNVFNQGGDIFYLDTDENGNDDIGLFNQSFREWEKTVDKKTQIVKYSNLIGLWNILPGALNTEANFKKMQNAYKSYVKSYEDIINEDKFYYSGKEDIVAVDRNEAVEIGTVEEEEFDKESFAKNFADFLTPSWKDLFVPNYTLYKTKKLVYSDYKKNTSKYKGYVTKVNFYDNTKYSPKKMKKYGFNSIAINISGNFQGEKYTCVTANIYNYCSQIDGFNNNFLVRRYSFQLLDGSSIIRNVSSGEPMYFDIDDFNLDNAIYVALDCSTDGKHYKVSDVKISITYSKLKLVKAHC